MKFGKVKASASRVLVQLTQHADLELDTFVFLGGMPYQKILFDRIRNVEVPMEGTPIGKQLQFLTEQTEEGLGDLPMEHLNEHGL